MAEAAAKLYSKPPISFETKQWLIEGKTVLEINIPKSREIPHLAQVEEGKWMVYIRKDDQDIVAPGILLKVWEQKKSPVGVHIPFTEEETNLLSLLTLNPFLSLNQYCRLAKFQYHKGEMMFVKLIVIGVVGMQISETGTRFFLRDDYYPL